MDSRGWAGFGGLPLECWVVHVQLRNIKTQSLGTFNARNCEVIVVMSLLFCSLGGEHDPSSGTLSTCVDRMRAEW